jgi:hypothetical protein
MAKRKANLVTELEKKNSERLPISEEKSSNREVDHEIGCPRCHDIMTLQSEFDRLGYFCEECDLLLYLN